MLTFTSSKHNNMEPKAENFVAAVTTVQPTVKIEVRKYDKDGNGEEVTCINLRAALKYIEQNPGAELTISDPYNRYIFLNISFTEASPELKCVCY